MTTTTIALQIQLPADPLLTAEQLQAITGRPQPSRQIEWLRDHRWHFDLAADGTILVGALYAHLRLAGLDPAGIYAPAAAGAAAGFNVSAAR